ncbi:ABC transporter permease [Angustibacter sp. McL0619]|uniref:ABC transporter permease n=1 Tax=Angustibacter sp. McL0619 TaxID=3415676 RepID=UPI003CF68D45
MTTTVPAPRSSLVPPSTTRFDRLVRSEAIKMFSLRSTGVTLLALIAVTVGISILACWGTMQAPADQLTDIDPVSLTLSGLAFGQLAIAVLGAMTIASEYSTGGIRSTLTAVPGRLHLLGAKAVVFLVVSFVVGAVTCVIAFVVGNLFLHEQYRSGFGDPHVLRALFGGALYVAGSGMYGFALGALIRQTAGAITAAVALLFVLPPLSNLLPGDWGDTITRHFTSNAGQQVMSTIPPGDNLGVWDGFFWFTLEWVVILAAAAVLMRKRDA